MARAAGEPLLHLGHGVGFSLCAGCEQFVVTVIAFIHTQVERMAELHLSCIGDIERYIFRAGMAPVAASGDTESYVRIMACSAGAVFFHLPHGMTGTIHPADEDATVTVDADIHLLFYIGVNLVAEKCRTRPEIHVWSSSMTLVAVAARGEGILTVMATTAGEAGIHIPHQVAFAVRTGNKEFAVAAAALIPRVQVELVTEEGVRIETYILDRMALRATAGYGECRLAVVTTAAGESVLHLFHGDMGVAAISTEELCMTVGAGKSGKMEFMAENNRTEIGDFDRDFFGPVAGCTLVQTEGTHLVVTQSAGFAGLHLGHGNRWILAADGKHGIVADSAVVTELG